MTKLTARQDMFCREYLIDLNATQAAIRAGYKKRTARFIGCENLTKPNIQSRINELKAEREEKTGIDAEWVLRQAVKVHERCMQEKEVLYEWGYDENGNKEKIPVLDDEGNTVYKFDANASLKALEIVGKHVNIQAFKEKSEIEHKGRIETIQINYDG